MPIIQCNYCSDTFSNPNSLRVHKSRKHREYIRPNKKLMKLNALQKNQSLTDSTQEQKNNENYDYDNENDNENDNNEKYNEGDEKNENENSEIYGKNVIHENVDLQNVEEDIEVENDGIIETQQNEENENEEPRQIVYHESNEGLKRIRQIQFK